jgi:hypothetical protein
MVSTTFNNKNTSCTIKSTAGVFVQEHKIFNSYSPALLILYRIRLTAGIKWHFYFKKLPKGRQPDYLVSPKTIRHSFLLKQLISSKDYFAKHI